MQPPGPRTQATCPLVKPLPLTCQCTTQAEAEDTEVTTEDMADMMGPMTVVGDSCRSRAVANLSPTWISPAKHSASADGSWSVTLSIPASMKVVPRIIRSSANGSTIPGVGTRSVPPIPRAATPSIDRVETGTTLSEPTSHIDIKDMIDQDMCYLVPFCHDCNMNRQINLGQGWTRVKPGTIAASVERPEGSDGFDDYDY